MQALLETNEYYFILQTIGLLTKLSQQFPTYPDYVNKLRDAIAKLNNAAGKRKPVSGITAKYLVDSLRDGTCGVVCDRKQCKPEIVDNIVDSNVISSGTYTRAFAMSKDSSRIIKCQFLFNLQLVPYIYSNFNAEMFINAIINSYPRYKCPTFVTLHDVLVCRNVKNKLKIDDVLFKNKETISLNLAVYNRLGLNSLMYMNGLAIHPLKKEIATGIVAQLIVALYRAGVSNHFMHLDLHPLNVMMEDPSTYNTLEYHFKNGMRSFVMKGLVTIIDFNRSVIDLSSTGFEFSLRKTLNNKKFEHKLLTDNVPYTMWYYDDNTKKMVNRQAFTSVEAISQRGYNTDNIEKRFSIVYDPLHDIGVYVEQCVNLSALRMYLEPISQVIANLREKYERSNPMKVSGHFIAYRDEYYSPHVLMELLSDKIFDSPVPYKPYEIRKAIVECTDISLLNN